MKTTTTTTRQEITDLFATYEKDVSAVLANLDRTSPAPILRQLQNARRADQVARNNPATAEDITDAEEAHATAREAIEELDKISRRLTATQADRIASAQEAGNLRTEADEARATAQDLAKVIARTLSERADLVQVAALADLEEPTPQELETAQRRAEERGEELTEEELTARAKQRHRRNAVARYVRAQRGNNAMNGTSTKTTQATPTDLAQWVKAGKPISKDYKEPTKNGTISIEWREHTKDRPAGFYIVRRYYTINQWQSIEALDEAGNPQGYIRTQNTLHTDLEAVERLEALANLANLTPREREYLAVFCGKTARQVGADARRAYHAERGRKATEAGANEAEYTARKAYAFDRIGLTTDTARRQFFSRLCRALAKVAPIEHTCTTPAEFAELDRRQWERLQQDHRRGYHADRTPRPDLIGAMCRANADQAPARPVVQWIETEHTTEPTSGKDYRAEEVERRAEADRARAEQTARQAIARTEAKQTARAEADRYWNEWNTRPTHPITAQEWNAIPAPARLAFLDHIHADGKRLLIV